MKKARMPVQMAEGKYSRYINELRKATEIKHTSAIGKIAQPNLQFDKRVLGETDYYIEHFLVYAPGSGIGIGGQLEGEINGHQLSDVPMKHDDFAEVFLFLGTNPEDNSDLGGEVDFWLGEGEEAEKYTITKTSCVYVPPGVVHCPIYFREVTAPIVMVVLANIREYSATAAEIPAGFFADK
jgi:mannose-6-phosphate isomerase-like protein (cupin superfamily)